MKGHRWFCFAVCLFITSVASAKKPVDLWPDGYVIVWESPYEEIEECTPDDAVKLSNGDWFVCDGYEYAYHYASVFLVQREFTFKGRPFVSTYLCLDDEDECLVGRILSR